MRTRLQSREHLPLLDLLRILASVAVVRHHERTDYLFGVGFGLPLFLVILLGLSSSSAEDEPIGGFARRKARYLLEPWLRWSIVYIAIAMLSDVARGRAAFGRLEPTMLFYGGNRSLWFLPFAAVGVVVAKLLQRVATPVPAAVAVLSATVIASVSTETVASVLTHDLPDMPVRAWLRVSPAVFWGLALGQSLRARSRTERRWLLFAAAAAAIVTFELSRYPGHPEDLPRRFAVAVPLACLGFASSRRLPRLVREVSSACFGIYLIHPLVGKVLGACFDVFAWPAAMHAGTVWGISFALVLAMRKLGLPWQECAPPAVLAPPRMGDTTAAARPVPESEPVARDRAALPAREPG